MLSLKQERTNHSQLISRFVLLAALAVAIIAVFSVSNGKATLTVPKISPKLMSEIGSSSETVPVLITTESHDYDAIVQAIEDAGGTVTQQYKYATGLAAELPKDAVFSISEMAGVQRVQMDEPRQLESGSTTADSIGGVLPLGSDLEAIDGAMRTGVAIPMDMADIQTISAEPMGADAEPSLYNVPWAMGATDVWGTGNFGQGSLAVVIDTGIYADHFMLDGNVIGGEDMSADVGTPFEGFDLATNHWHGTHVSGIIAGHGALVLPNDSLLVQSVELYTGESLPPFDADNKIFFLFGNAPATQLYGIKVFDHTGGSASNSLIIAAIERAIDLKLVDGLDVDLINMSLGGGTGYEGRDLESQAVDAATEADITVVVSAGNDGPASLMIGSPAGANTAVTVAAAATAINSRVFWDQNFGILGVGSYLYTTDDDQVIYFSSRGPTSDGRMKPDTTGIGVFVLSSFNTEANPQSIAFASGTSMSSPSVAGVVSLLNTWGETVGASPYDYKEAVMDGSNPIPYYDKYDQGAGFVNAADAMEALQADKHYGSVQSPLSSRHSGGAQRPKGTYIPTGALMNGYTIDIKDLAPGHVQDYWFKLRPDAERITIDVTDVDLGDDPILFNSFELHVSSAVRTTDCCYYVYSTNVWGDASFTIEDLNTEASGDIFGVNLANFPMMPGYVRLVIENDWTTFDNISGKFTVKLERNRDNSKDEFHKGMLNNGEDSGFFPVGFGPEGVAIELSWLRDWTRYSSSDMDMIIAWYDTDGILHYEFGGATFSSPEKVVLEADNIDAVYVLVDGFETYDQKEPWKMKVNYLGD
ncbi:MAG: S8 family serine peptidase [Chloroflexi bacterium]|nr:S8 family serine peptidase [Chloroflexota bacterium]